MLIKKKSGLTGNTSVREIAVTASQISRWQGGELIQRVMPELSNDDREFLMTGITPEEWDATFGSDD